MTNRTPRRPGTDRNVSPDGGKPQRNRQSPSDRRRESRRAIERELENRWAEWEGGGRSHVAARLSDLRLERHYDEMREASGEPGDRYAGHTTAPFTQPPKPTAASAPGRWPTRRTRAER